MSQFFVEAIDQLDAEICSGDSLFILNNIEVLEEHIERWQRVIASTKEMLEELNNEK